MKSIGAEFLRPDTLPGVNHMHGMQYKIVQNNKFTHTTSTLISFRNHPLVTSYNIAGQRQ